MTTPGMFADGSLYKTSGRYHLTAASKAANGIEPAQLPNVFLRGTSPERCFWRCLAATCMPSPLDPDACFQMCARRCSLWGGSADLPASFGDGFFRSAQLRTFNDLAV